MTTINDIEFIIPCGGKSTRNYPHSQSVPHKSLLPFGDMRLIDKVLKDVLNIGGRHITIVCSNQEVIDKFKESLAPDYATEEKLRKAGRTAIADALRDTFLPDDIDLKFTIQDKPLGTAHVLGLAHRLSHDRHGMMIFPDDVILSNDDKNTHFARMVNAFLENPKQILLTGIEQENVSNNSIIHENRLIEKPKIFYNHIAGYSPIIIPKENLDFIERQVDTFEQTGKLPDNLPMAEWVYTDGINQFLDSVPEGSYNLKMFMKSEKDLLIDTGTLPLYELAQVRALLTLSRFKEDNKKLARELLNV